MNHSEQLNELAAALSKAQAEMDHAVKDSTNPHFKSKYADLSSVWAAIREPLTKNGLSVIQLPSEDETGKVHVSTMLLHSSGQFIEARYALPATKADAQGYGSAITYMKRYALAGMGVAPDDDDGEGAVGRAKNGNGIHANGNGNYGRITADQVQTLRDMLESSKGDTEKFCAYFKIKALPDLSAADYTRAVEALNTKLHPKQAKVSHAN